MSKHREGKQTWVTCQKCKEETNLADLEATLHRENWYHLLVGRLWSVKSRLKNSNIFI
ncbi:MAG: hypothetical protein ACT4OD_03715 [Candidatus Nitrosotenuis sp.]